MNAGEQVRCLINCPGEFTKGRVYITAHSAYPERVRVVADDSGEANGLASEYFEPALAQPPETDDDVVELTIGELTDAIAEALKVVRRKRLPALKVGDKVTLSATVTGGVDGPHINIVEAFTGRSLTFPRAALTVQQ